MHEMRSPMDAPRAFSRGNDQARAARYEGPRSGQLTSVSKTAVEKFKPMLNSLRQRLAAPFRRASKKAERTPLVVSSFGPVSRWWRAHVSEGRTKSPRRAAFAVLLTEANRSFGRRSALNCSPRRQLGRCPDPARRQLALRQRKSALGQHERSGSRLVAYAINRDHFPTALQGRALRSSRRSPSRRSLPRRSQSPRSRQSVRSPSRE
jgi:hypothetical protein